MIHGIKINKLLATGQNCDDATINFSSSAHVIIGPSNTGKSYIFQCIKYLLGSSQTPKKIKESYGYDDCYLEICLADNSINTIQRSLSGGDANLYECSYSEILNYTKKPEVLIVGRKATKKTRTLNSYFLTILDLNDKKIRRNKSGISNDLSFSFLRHLTLIDETSIIKEDSPVYTGQNGENTKEESILRFLLTGQDDSGIASKPKQQVIDNRKGRMEVIDSLIEDYYKELSEFDEASINSDEINFQIEKLGASIAFENEKLKELYERVDIYESTINNYWNKWKENESRLLTINEIISRLELLKQHYDSDLSRLESLQESSTAYANLDFGTCPICNSIYDVKNHESCSSEEIDNLLLASSAEISKIKSLKIELEKTRSNLLIEKEDLLNEITDNKSKHNEIQIEKSAFISGHIKSTVNKLDSLRVMLRDRKQVYKIANKLNYLISQKEGYEIEIDPMDGDYNFDELTTSTTSKLCNIVQKLLCEWKYSKNTSVSFSEETCDLVIDGHDRNLAGKGYRALSYSAFSIGLMHTCLKYNLPHSGVVILDSPLCTLRSRHVKRSNNIENGDVISDETKEAFYSSIAKYKGLGQIIILDNDGPTNPEYLDIGYTEFTEDTNVGRYGFFTPVKSQ